MFKQTAQETFGWFNRPPYESSREPYQEVVVKFRDFDNAKPKGKQGGAMRVKLDQPPFKSDGEMKSRAANQDGYFNKEFIRLFEKEGPGRQSFTLEGEKKGKNTGRVKLEQPPYVPPSPGKLNSGLGNYYGTFHGKYEHWDPTPRGQGPLVFEPTNFLTSPLKKGTGYGYVGVTLNKYPEYKSTPYQSAATMANLVKGKLGGRVKISDAPFYSTIRQQETFDNGDCFRPPKKPVKPTKAQKQPMGYVPFKQEAPFTPSNPGKKDGGCRAGGFSKWPDHYPKDPYSRIGPEYPKNVKNKEGKTYLPINTTCPYSQRYNSHITQIVKKEINTHNYKTRVPGYKVFTFDTTWTRDQWNFKKGLAEC